MIPFQIQYRPERYSMRKSCTVSNTSYYDCCKVKTIVIRLTQASCHSGGPARWTLQAALPHKKYYDTVPLEWLRYEPLKQFSCCSGFIVTIFYSVNIFRESGVALDEYHATIALGQPRRSKQKDDMSVSLHDAQISGPRFWFLGRVCPMAKLPPVVQLLWWFSVKTTCSLSF